VSAHLSNPIACNKMYTSCLFRVWVRIRDEIRRVCRQNSITLAKHYSQILYTIDKNYSHVAALDMYGSLADLGHAMLLVI